MSMPPSTVRSIIRLYQTESRVESLPRGRPRPQALTEEEKRAIRAWLSDDCCLTLRRIKERCAEALNKAVSISTIDRVISGFRFSLKRLSLQPERRNDQTVVDMRARYASLFMELLSTTPDNKIFFLDEAGFSASMRLSRGRSERGSRAVLTVPSLRSRNISVCACISKFTTVAYRVETCPFNSQLFKEFIISLVDKLRNDGIENAKIIADNVAFHKNRDVAKVLEDCGHSMLFLPPYSPFLNPIENIFSKWKHKVKEMQVNNEQELFESIDNGSQLISDDDCQNCFRHMLSYIPRCIRSETIVD
jgi:transposase